MSIECGICERDARAGHADDCPRAMAKSLKRTDVKLLQDALKSNGGGINPDRYSDASRDRLFEAGLIQWKPNHCSVKTGYTSLITITTLGKSRLLEQQKT